MKRFVTAVFMHETNTFSPVPTPIGAFGRYAGESGPVYGEEALAPYRGTNTPVAAFIDLAAGAELVFPVAANANPSGRAPDSVLDHCAERICEAVRSRCDAAFLDLHGCFTHAGIDPARKRYILIKSRQHFRAGFEPIIAHVVMVSGPGITTSDYGLLPWKNVRRPVYPLDPDTEPNLPVATERTPRAEGA